MIQLWEWSSNRGAWFPLRKVDDDAADANLDALRKGSPHVQFVASRTQPRGNPMILGKLKNVRR